MQVLTNASGHQFKLHPWECPICCKKDERQIGFRGGKHQRYGNGVETRIVQCRECSLLYSNPFPVPVEPQELYGDPAHYFEQVEFGEKLKNCKTLVEEIRKLSGKAAPSILDVGSGRGEMVLAATEMGLKVVGLEFSSAMIEQAKKYGARIVPQTIEEFAAESTESFDSVVMNAVLEHVQNPDSMIEAASRLLRPGGVLYIDVPHEPSLLTFIGNGLNRLRGNKAVFNLSPTWPPYHVYGFNRKSLTVLLKKYGIVIERYRCYASPHVPAGKKWKDRLSAVLGSQINRVANLTGTAGNLHLWARKIS